LKYEDRDIHVSQQPPPPAPFIEPVPVIAAVQPPCAVMHEDAYHPAIGSIIDPSAPEGLDQFGPGSDFVRVTDDQ